MSCGSSRLISQETKILRRVEKTSQRIIDYKDAIARFSEIVWRVEVRAACDVELTGRDKPLGSKGAVMKCEECRSWAGFGYRGRVICAVCIHKKIERENSNYQQYLNESQPKKQKRLQCEVCPSSCGFRRLAKRSRYQQQAA
jgi:hypothetical protein